MGLFRSIGQWFKALGYLLTGRVDSARSVLETNPHAVRAKFDTIIREKKSRIQEYQKAVATLVAQQEKKMATVKSLTEEMRRLENLKTGAAAKAKQIVEQLAGQSDEAIRDNDEYKKCLAAFNDFSSTLAEKQARIQELEAAINEYSQSIGNHKIQLQQLLRDVDGLKAEAAETVADIITAKEEKELGDLLTGISEDSASQELDRMRDLRQQVKAESRISRELAGTDTKMQEAEFLDYARTSEASSEFDALIGLSAAKDDASAPESDAPAADTKLPE